MILIVLIFFLIFIFLFPTFRCAILHPVKLLYNVPKDAYFYFAHKQYNNASFGRIIGYIADSATSFGCGKTLSVTDAIVSMYRRYNNKPVWCSRRKQFVTQKIKVISNVDFLTIPYERLLSLAQFVQWTDKVTELDDENNTLTVTYVLIDEASSQMNSRSFKGNFDMYFISRLLTSRHVKSSFYLTSQRSGMVDKLMRDCCNLYIGCDKWWRFQRQNYYDAYEVENAQNPALVRPLRRTCWFVTDKSFANYDTFACVQSLRKSCESGDMLSEAEILSLQCNQDANLDATVKPSRKFIRNMRKRTK